MLAPRRKQKESKEVISPPGRHELIDTNAFIVHSHSIGTGRPILLIHGGGAWLFTFSDLMKGLSRHYMVRAIDLPGHGFTRPKTDNPCYSLETVLSVISQCIDAWGIEHLVLCGHSWGGGFAAAFAALNPKLTDGLVLISPSGLHARDTFLWELMKLPVIGRIIPYFINKFIVKSGLKKAYSDPSLVTERKVSAYSLGYICNENKNALAEYSRNIDWKRISSLFCQITCPVLILWGEKDQYVPVQTSKKFIESINNCRLKIFKNGGHNLHEEKTAEVTDLIHKFMMDS